MKNTQESRIKTSKNSDETEGLKFEISDQNKQISKQNDTISELENEIEELKNRSLRKTPFFKNIKHQVNENSWPDTKKVLIDAILKKGSDRSIQRGDCHKYRNGT